MNARRIVLSHAALAFLAASAVACANADQKKQAAWSCGTSDVPMGEVVHCTQSAMTADGPTVDPGLDVEACSGPSDNSEICTTVPLTEYECNAGEPECPPVTTTPTGGAGGSASDGTTGGTSDGTTAGSTGGTTGGAGGSTSDSTGTAQGDQGGSSPGKSGNGTGGGGGNGNSTPGANGNGSKSGDYGSAGPDECAYVPELPYCAGGSGTSDGSTGGGTSDGNTGKGSKNGQSDQGGSAPGQEKKDDGASSGGASSGGSSGGGASTGSSGKGKHYKCKKDKKGNKSCESVPDCATGTHPSSCGACVPDGESIDCVPPSEGGCWVTGGGFIIGPNITTGAAPDGHDNFGGNAKPMKDGRIQGHWNHVDHGTGNHAKGVPAYIVCRHVDEPGPGQPGGKKGFTMNQVYFGGPAEWRSNGQWASGYWFDVVAKDHGEPGSVPHVKNGQMPDTYHFTIRLMDDPAAKVSGAIVYETKEVLEGGNIQLHPPNNGHPYTPSGLPEWVSFEP
jgi:hypothetical protein